MKNEKSSGLSRRELMVSAGAAAATVMVLPSGVLGRAGATGANARLAIGKIGCDGMGGGDLNAVAGHATDIVALCDVDWNRGGGAFKRFPKAKKYKDWRKMYDEMAKSIDAVVVSTPDHHHAAATMAGIKRGMHAYTQKPLTRTVLESYALADAAEKHKVVTQMGNQGHGGGGLPRTIEYINAGAIGTVREVHVWTDRSGGWWPQGINRPAGALPVPKDLPWDVWLGPAPVRPYNTGYHPFAWRGWWDFGAGALGDMACHNMDPAFAALHLGEPTSVKAQCSPFNGDSFPKWSIIEWRFPALGDRPAVKMFWYDGGKKPPKPEDLGDRGFGGNGCLFIGDKGKMLGGSHAGFCRMIPDAKMNAFPAPPQTLPRSIGHYKEWVEAARGATKVVPGSNFGYSGPMTAAILLGNVALFTPGRELKWDGKARRFTNNAKANTYLDYPHRKGWEV